MSARSPRDWQAFGGSDPVPGDPDLVRKTAEQYARTSTALDGAASNLRRLDSADTSSEAVTKILVNAHELAGQLELVKVRYDVASTALRNYAPVLEEAQRIADWAADSASGSARERTEAANRANELRWQVYGAGDLQQRDQLFEEYNQQHARYTQADESVSIARKQLQQAIDQRDQAANRAAAQIEEAVEGSPINDSFFDRVADVFDRVTDTDWLAKTDILSKIGDALGWLSLAVTVVGAIATLIFPPAGAIILAAGRIIGIASLVFSIAGGLLKGFKTGNWTGFASTVVSALLAKFGGKLFSGLGKVVSGGLGKIGQKLGRHLPAGALKKLTQPLSAPSQLWNKLSQTKLPPVIKEVTRKAERGWKQFAPTIKHVTEPVERGWKHVAPTIKQVGETAERGWKQVRTKIDKVFESEEVVDKEREKVIEETVEKFFECSKIPQQLFDHSGATRQLCVVAGGPR